MLKDDITLERLKQATLFIVASPKEMFTKAELDAMKSYLEQGGNIFVMSGDGGENKYILQKKLF